MDEANKLIISQGLDVATYDLQKIFKMTLKKFSLGRRFSDIKSIESYG